MRAVYTQVIEISIEGFETPLVGELGLCGLGGFVAVVYFEICIGFVEAVVCEMTEAVACLVDVVGFTGKAG